MCIVLDELKNSLLSNAKDICIEILQNELAETLNTPVETIKKGSEKFNGYMKCSREIYDVILDGKRIVIPIVEFEGVAFFISIEDFSLDIHTFIDKVSGLFIFSFSICLVDIEEVELRCSYSAKPEGKTRLLANIPAGRQ